MAFVCPGCGRGELCPASPCEDAPGVGHEASLKAVQEMVCRHCGLGLSRDDLAHPGYLGRCLEQEAAALAAPWRRGLGRDLEPLDLSLLAEHHWIRVDQASHELENAPAILAQAGLAGGTGTGGGTAPLRAAVARTAEAAAAVLAAVIRGLGHDRAPVLTELRLVRALCAGSADDWKSCVEGLHAAAGELPALASLRAAVQRLAASPRSFVDDELARNAAVAAAAAAAVAGEAPAGIAAAELWESESRLVLRWAPDAVADAGAAAAWPVPDCLEAWSLRRMWLCPDLGWDPLPGGEEGEEEEP